MEILLVLAVGALLWVLFRVGLVKLLGRDYPTGQKAKRGE